MTERQERPSETREEAIQRLREVGERMPEVADALRAYAALHDIGLWQLVEARPTTTYATGGNAA